jgi:uncharacterized LabA/DUF88 family protein
LRAAIFIDGAYILSLLKQNNINPDYSEFVDYILRPLRKSVPIDLMRCYFYYCAPWMSPEPTQNEKRRMEEHDIFMLKIMDLDRWAVRLGKLQKRRDGYKEYFEQKRVDVLLSVDMVRHSAAGHIQHAILVAGDSDFIPAVEATKESGATVTLWCGEETSVHRDLIGLADIVQIFDWKKFPQIKEKTGLFHPSAQKDFNKQKRHEKGPDGRHNKQPLQQKSVGLTERITSGIKKITGNN